MTVNKVILLGNVGKDPEIKSSQGGKEIASFILATSESWKDKTTGERSSKTEWHKVVVFSQTLVGIVKSYVRKGTKLYLEGQLQTRKWTNNQGAESYTTEVILQNFGSSLQILGSKNEDSKSQKKTSSQQEEIIQDDEIPF
jgi:single-strand DNA-binding protein